MRTNLPAVEGTARFNHALRAKATGTASPGTVSALARPPLRFPAPVHYHEHTDFFEQRLRSHDPTCSLLAAVRSCVFNLTNTPAIMVHNRPGPAHGLSCVQTHTAAAPGSFVNVTVEFHSPTRIRPNPMLPAALTTPAIGMSIASGTPQPTHRGLLPAMP